VTISPKHFTRKFSKNLVVSCCAALLVAASASGVASAQTLPFGLATPNPNDPVVQIMLAGEAGAVAQFLGISTDQLATELNGHSLAQVAQAHGRSASDVTAVVVNTADGELDTAVSNGQLTSDTAAQYKAQIGLFAPFLVSSKDASALALQAATN
jgi:ABC-type sugar transport system substrate-binding protein